MPYDSASRTLEVPDYSIPEDETEHTESITYSGQRLVEGIKTTLSDIPSIVLQINQHALGRLDQMGDPELAPATVYIRQTLPENPRDYHRSFWLIDNSATHKTPQWQLFYTDEQANSCREIPLELITNLSDILAEKDIGTLSDEEKIRITEKISQRDQDKINLEMLINAIAEGMFPDNTNFKQKLLAEIHQRNIVSLILDQINAIADRGEGMAAALNVRLSPQAKFLFELLANLNQKTALFRMGPAFHADIKKYRHYALSEAPNGKGYTVEIDPEFLKAKVTLSNYYNECHLVNSDNFDETKEFNSAKNRLRRELKESPTAVALFDDIQTLKNRAEGLVNIRSSDAQINIQDKIDNLTLEINTRKLILLAKISYLDCLVRELNSINVKQDEETYPELKDSLLNDLNEEIKTLAYEEKKLAIKYNLISNVTQENRSQERKLSLLEIASPFKLNLGANSLVSLHTIAKEAAKKKQEATPGSDDEKILSEIELEAYHAIEEQTSVFTQDNIEKYEKAETDLINKLIELAGAIQFNFNFSEEDDEKIASKNLQLELAKYRETTGINKYNALNDFLEEIEIFIAFVENSAIKEISKDAKSIIDALSSFKAAKATLGIYDTDSFNAPATAEIIQQQIPSHIRQLLTQAKQSTSLSNKVEFYANNEITLNSNGTEIKMEIIPGKNRLVVHDEQEELVTSVFSPELLQSIQHDIINTQQLQTMIELNELTLGSTIVIINHFALLELSAELQENILNYFATNVSEVEHPKEIHLSINSASLTDEILSSILDNAAGRISTLNLKDCFALTTISSTQPLEKLTELSVTFSKKSPINLKEVNLITPILEKLKVPPLSFRHFLLQNSEFGISPTNQEFCDEILAGQPEKITSLPKKINTLSELYLLEKLFNYYHYYPEQLPSNIEMIEDIIALLNQTADKADLLGKHSERVLRVAFHKYKNKNPGKVIYLEPDERDKTLVNTNLTQLKNLEDILSKLNIQSEKFKNIKWIDVHKINIGPLQIEALINLYSKARLFLKQKQRQEFKQYQALEALNKSTCSLPSPVRPASGSYSPPQSPITKQEPFASPSTQISDPKSVLVSPSQDAKPISRSASVDSFFQPDDSPPEENLPLKKRR